MKMKITRAVNPLNASVALIQTGFYMRATKAFNGLRSKSLAILFQEPIFYVKTTNTLWDPSTTIS